MSKKVILGGTFDHVHIGHRKFLETALEEGKVTIGLVSDKMLKEWKPEVNRTFEERKRNIQIFLSRFNQNWKIIPINDPYKEAVEGEYDVLVVSYDTKERGKEINKKRKEKGKKPLDLKTVKPVLAEDLLPVKSTRIREGEINELGDRLTPVRIKIGSKNKVKIKIIEEVLSDYFEIETICEEVNNIPEQPINEEVIHSARKRAAVSDDFDYGIGVESGIIESEKGTFSVEYTFIKDKYGFESTGHGPGFSIPEKWNVKDVNFILEDKMKVYFDDYSDDSGPIGLLTDDKITREDCIRASILTAMIPRLNSDIYFNENGF